MGVGIPGEPSGRSHRFAGIEPRHRRRALRDLESSFASRRITVDAGEAGGDGVSAVEDRASITSGRSRDRCTRKIESRGVFSSSPDAAAAAGLVLNR